MKQTIKNIIDFIRSNKGKQFINIYPYFAVVDDNGIIGDRVSIDNDYCYWYNVEDDKLYVQNYISERSRVYKVSSVS